MFSIGFLAAFFRKSWDLRSKVMCIFIVCNHISTGSMKTQTRRLDSFSVSFHIVLPGVSATISIHLVTPTAVLKLGSASSPGAWHQITRPLTATSVLKTEFFIPISTDERATISSFRVLANHLASFFFLTLSCDSFELLYGPLCPLLYPPGWCYGVQIAWPTF